MDIRERMLEQVQGIDPDLMEQEFIKAMKIMLVVIFLIPVFVFGGSMLTLWVLGTLAVVAGIVWVGSRGTDWMK